ncbi:hypothetical protein [Puia sp.]|uniref:hypothetical protein n=1 Tax=Puia sp. TaxID=2045100 RepID=UPI002F42D10A
MEANALIQDLNKSYELGLRDVPTLAELETLLAERVNGMIRQDFGALVQLLYRIDVNEARLRGLLQENAGEDAALVIARLILERQWQKIETRRRYRQDPNGEGNRQDPGGGEERW